MKNVVGYWTSVNDGLPEKNGSYLTIIKTKVYNSVGFTQFIDGEFMSSFVTHWAKVYLPDVEDEIIK